jgi:hypothetical protein
MSNKKLNLVRETILPLASVELTGVVGGVVSDCIPPRTSRPNPSTPPSLPSLPSTPPDSIQSCLSLGNSRFPR